MSFDKTLLVVKESAPGEARVCLIPKDVKQLSGQGFAIKVEAGAGEGAGYTDSDYEKSGATICENHGDYPSLFQDIHYIVRAKRPNRVREMQEAKAFSKSHCLIGALDPFDADGHIDEYQKAGLSAYSIDQLPLPTDSPMNILASMSKIAGELALVDALEKSQQEIPQKALIIGTGIAGMAAIHKAYSLGLELSVVTTRLEIKKQLESQSNTNVFLLDKHAPLSEQQSMIKEHAIVSDIIITSARASGQKAPCLVPKETLHAMRKGACIVDLALSEGGNVEGSHHDKTLSLGNDIIVTNVSGYPKVKPFEASVLWSYATRLFLEALYEPSQLSLLNQAKIT